MGLNRKGFTLVEVLAVIVILGLLAVIMIPNVGVLIEQNKNNSYDELKNSIVMATRNFFSDYRYQISVDGNCNDLSEKKNIISINNVSLADSKVSIKMLVDRKYLSSNIINDPRDSAKELNIDDSYVIVSYSCQSKNYLYDLKDSYLIWN